MPPFIKDDVTADLVSRLAKQRGVSKQAAARQAVRAQLDRDAQEVPLLERMKRFWAAHPKPPPTGDAADKAFYDELSGDL